MSEEDDGEEEEDEVEEENILKKTAPVISEVSAVYWNPVTCLVRARNCWKLKNF